MTGKEILLEQFTACYDENGWFVALKNTLENLTAGEANWKTANLDNSIGEILTHLNFYNEAYLKRFKGVDYVYQIEDNDETFTSAASEKDWQAEIERFNAIMSEWRELLDAAGDDRFDEAVSKTNQASWAKLLSNLNAHNAYHGGQIVVIRKLQGSWSAAQEGVS